MRLAASIIDGLIVNAFVWIGTFVIDQIFILNMVLYNVTDTGFLIFKAWYGFGYWFVVMLYEVVFCGSSLQATPGKIILKMKIVNYHGDRISYSQSLKRFLGKFLAAVFFIGFIMVAFTERKQGLHDKIAGTLVVESENSLRSLLKI